MDARYINPFIGSICNTVETMCGMAVRVGKPKLKTDGSLLTDVSGIIGFSGDAAGSVVLHFTFDTASKIATAFAGMEITPQHPDFADAIGELANMVAGGAKSTFEGFSIDISLPNVVIGEKHNVSPMKNAPRILIPCATDAGEFHVEVGMIMASTSGACGQATTTGAHT